MQAFFDLNPHDSIIDSFINLGSLAPNQCSLSEDGLFQGVLQPLERFTCMGYLKKENPSTPISEGNTDGPFTLPELRWKLYSNKNKEAENLPPCRATLSPLIQRNNYVSRVYKSYKQTHPDLHDLTESGWTREESSNTLSPVYCLMPPAPKAILELV